MKIFLVGDDGLLVRGLRAAFSDVGYQVVLTDSAPSVIDALAHDTGVAGQHLITVLLEREDRGPWDVIDQLPLKMRRATFKVVVLAHDLVSKRAMDRVESWYPNAVVRASLSVPELLRVIEDVVRGFRVAGPTIPMFLKSASSPVIVSATALPELTPREYEIMHALQGGEDINQIAARLSISSATVRTLLSRIKAKYGVRTLDELHQVPVAGSISLSTLDRSEP